MREPEPDDHEGLARTALAEKPEIDASATTDADEEEFSTGRSLLTYAGTWVGDDADDPLEAQSMADRMDEPAPDETPVGPDDPDFSTARAPLKHVGKWQGDDLEEVLTEVYASRSKTRC